MVAAMMICCFFFVSCEQEAQSVQDVAYASMKIGASDVNLSEIYPASIEGRQDIAIFPQVSGTISNVCVKEGQRVKKGQALFVIDQVPF